MTVTMTTATAMTMATTELIMRITFNIEMTVDVVLADDKRKKVFIDLVTKHARSLYAVSAILTKKRPPEMKLSMIDGDGKGILNIFTPKSNEENSNGENN